MVLPRQSRYDHPHVFGAGSCGSGDAVAMLAPRVDTAVMVPDRAGWHVSKDLVIPANLTPIHLPPRLPELNPMENPWRWITSHHRSNRVHGDYDAMLDSAAQVVSATIRDRERVKTVCNAPYPRRANQV